MEWYTNRTWMYEMTNSDGFINMEYCDNLVKWLDFVYSKDSAVDSRLTKRRKIVLDIKCPCSRCQNSIYLDRETVHEHLLTRGFMPNYYKWCEHGDTSSDEVGQLSTTRGVVNDNDDDDDDDDDDGCRRMVLDSMHLADCNPIIHSNVDSNTFESSVPNPEAMKFYDMLQATDEPLWEGEKSTHCSKLQAITSFLNWKSLYNVSNACYDHIMFMVKELMPEGNKLPENFYDTKKSLEKLFLPKERIDVCRNHCMLFYKQDVTLTRCKWCGESRYQSGQNKVPHLVMTYMPIGPRLKKLYMSTKTAKDMTWHHDHKTKDGSMAHPSDGKAWKHFDSENPGFTNEIRNVRLGLCTDGFNPNNSNSKPYSLWPVFLTIYNLPPWMSLKDSYIKLCLVIPGRKSPGQNVDVFLRPLIDELKELYEEGIEVYDAYRKENFMMKAILLWTEKTLKRRANFGEFWLQTHAKKGSRPLDRLSGADKSVENGSGEDNDVEDTTQQQNVTWVDTRAGEAYSTYNKCAIEKYGDDTSLHPEIDMELLSKAVGGKKKGRLYGTCNMTRPRDAMPSAPSGPSTHGSYPQERSNSDEVQHLKEKIAELEQDKIEKQAMMEKIEASARLYAEMNEKIQLLSQNAPQNPPPT